MRSTGQPVLAWAAAGVCVALGVVAFWLAVAVPSPSGAYAELRALFPAGSLVFGLVGLLILKREPGNRFGWVALGLTFSSSATSIASDLSTAYGGRTSRPGLELGLMSDIGWLVWISLIAWFLLLFPDGRLPSRRWRPLGWTLAAWPPLFLLTALLAPQTISGGASVPNPFGGMGGAAGELLNQLVVILSVLMIPLLIGALFAAIVRFRRSRGVERQQLKWLAYWAALFGVALIVSAALPNEITNLAVNLAVLGLPLTVAVAVLRYRLYDIDLLINRTVVYAVTSASLVVTFFIGIVALQMMLRPLTAGSELAVAASTLMSFALFQPVRRRVQGVVDRRFDRSRYDAARTLESFADRLRDEVDLDALRSDLLSAVERTMAPAHANLWLRKRP